MSWLVADLVYLSDRGNNGYVRNENSSPYGSTITTCSSASVPARDNEISGKAL